MAERRAKGELPDRSLTAQVPMTLRGDNKGEAGNQIGVAVMPIHSEIADPLERLTAIRAGADGYLYVSGLGAFVEGHIWKVNPRTGKRVVGWNPGENIEKFDTKFLAERFSFDRVGKSNSKFDRDKLRAFNAICKFIASFWLARMIVRAS